MHTVPEKLYAAASRSVRKIVEALGGPPPPPPAAVIAQAPRPKRVPGVTHVAGSRPWRPSSPGVVAAFMAAMAFGHEGARPASSYRGARRNLARIERRAALA
jgi:hypothetical protein